MYVIIREKILLTIIVTIIFLTLSSFFIAGYYIMLNHMALEEEITGINTEQASFAIERQALEISATAKDWATWNDTYDYLQGTNPGYADINIADTTFPTIDINSIVLVDGAGRVVYTRSYDLRNETQMETPPDLVSRISHGSPLIMSSDKSNLTGIVVMDSGPMMIAAYPVLPGYGAGPVAGTLIMAKYVDKQFPYEATVNKNTSVDLYALNEAVPQDVSLATESLRNNPKVYISTVSDNRIAGYKLINDVYHQPAIVLKVETDRPVYQQGNDSILYSTGFVAITGVIIFGLVAFLLESMIISRLSRLHESVKKISKSKSRSGRVPLEGDDELTELAEGINRMLDALEQSQKKLEEINHQYKIINEELETRVATRTTELEKANKALETEVAGHKQAGEDLIRAQAQAELYLDLMGHDISNLNQIALGYLELAQDNLKLDADHKELIGKPVDALNSSTRLINNVRKLQRATERRTDASLVDISALLSSIREEYSTSAGKSVTINYDPKPGSMVYADELLAEVFSNLVNNSIKHSPGPITINLNVDRHTEGEKEYYVVSVEDNGPGVPDSIKGILFSRLTKGRPAAAGRGLGLYLVRTLVNTYGGKVWVEDKTPGDHTNGSRFLVMLPAAMLR